MRYMICVKNNINHGFIVMKATAFTTYKEWAAFRSHMAVSLFVGPVFFLVQMFIWKAVFTGRETLSGLTLEQMITYYGIAAVINYLIYDSADWNLQMLIKTGKFLTFMLRPLSHCYYALCQKIGHRLLAIWVEFIPIYLIFYFLLKVKLVPESFIWSIISITLSFILYFLTNYCIGASAFWLTRTDGIRRAFQVIRDLSTGVLLPLTLFPMAMQKVLFFLPFQFITYVPIRVFIGSYELAGIKLSIPEVVGLQAVAVVVMYILYRVLWHFGMKRFTGVGA